MTIPAPDPQTFHWIKDALDGSMNAVMSQVRQVEQDSDYDLLTTVPGNLHQINGSLRMVELDAAGILAEDLEALCQHLCGNHVDGDEASTTLAILVEGLESLQGYIDAISRQAPVSPLGLVPQINAVRQITGREAITRLELFEPPLDLLNLDGRDGQQQEAQKPDGPRRVVPDDLRIRLVTQLRRKYRRALVSWLANKDGQGDSKIHLDRIEDLLEHLFRISSLDISQQLWWVAGGFVEAVASGDLDVDNRIKTQFARLDIEISRLEDENTSGIAVDPPDQLLRQLLFYIGAIEGPASERVREIQDTLHLTKWFDLDDREYRALVHASAQLHELGEVFGTEDFSQLEDILNIYFAGFGESEPVIDLEPVLESLGILAGAVEKTGLAPLSGLLDGLSEAIRTTSEQPDALSSTQADIKIASALLFIRDSIARPDQIDATWQQSVDSHQQELTDLAGSSRTDSERALRVRKVAEIEYQHARSAVAVLVRETLAGLEALLVTDSRTSEITADDLTAAAHKLAKIASVLVMAQNELAAKVATRLSEWLAQLGSSAVSPGDDNLEHMAFAVAALGVTADHLSHSGPEADKVLQTALDRLQELDISELEPLAGREQSVKKTGDDESKTMVQPGDNDEWVPALQSMVDSLDYQRRQLNTENHNGVRALMESFEALSIADEADPPIQKLAAMGRSLCSSVLDNDSEVTPEKHDFIGLLIRQVKDLAVGDTASDRTEQDSGNASGIGHAIDMNAWQRRLQELSGVNPGSVDAGQIGSAQQDEDPVRFAESDLDLKDEGDIESLDSGDDDITELIAPGLAQLDLDLRTIFVEELGSHLQTLQQGLNSYRVTEPGSPEATRALTVIDDCVHTLSGNCRNLGFDEAADCAEAAVAVLANDRSLDRNARLAHFAESLILLSQARSQVRENGKYDIEIGDKLKKYLERSNVFQEVHEDDTREDDYDIAGFSEDTTGLDEARVDQDLADPGEGRSNSVPVDVVETVTDSSPPSSPPEAPDSLDKTEPSEQSQTAPALEKTSANEQDKNKDEDHIDEDIDEEIRQIFIEESESILGRINGYLIELRGGADHTAVLAGIRREFHTLKGSAAATGFDDISALSHRVESLLESQPLDEWTNDSEQGRKILDLLEEMHDGLAVDLGIMQSDAKGHLPGLDRKIDQFLGITKDTDTDIGTAESVEDPVGAPAGKVEVIEAGESAVQPDEPGTGPEIEPETEYGEPEENLVGIPGELAGQAEPETESEPEVEVEPEPEIETRKLDDDNPPQNHPETTDTGQPDTALHNGGDAGPGMVAESIANDVTDGLPGQETETTRSDDDMGEDAIEQARSWMPNLIEQSGGSRSQEDTGSGGMLRIGNTRLAALINSSGELSVVRSQLQDTLDATRMDLDVLRASMSSMRAGLRDLELEADAQIRSQPEQQTVSVEDDFDPLQLDRYSRLQAKSREVTELLDQLAKVERDLGSRTSSLDGALRQQVHLGDQLQSGLMSARMVNMAEYLPRLRFLVRETSRQSGKPIELKFKGGDIHLDRQVIETMMAPFEHMIRNAVAHGIEDPETRKASGKLETGTISLTLSQQGSELVAIFEDDGSGLDLQKLQSRAVDLGLADSTEVVSDVDLLQVITQPGYSTADALTMEAGRGVGMDVVYQAVRDLGGSMTLDNRPGQGVTFQFRLPVTLALAQALLVRVAGWRFAVRSRSIERLMRVAESDVFQQDGERMLSVDGHDITLFSVRERLGEPESKTSGSFLSVLLVRLADRLAAFEVDEFDDSVNIVSKTPGRQLESIPEVSGVTVLADSSIVLILDLEAFIDRIAPLRVPGGEEVSRTKNPDAVLRRVLVVDDSLVVRKVMQKDLEADGLDVESAVDGINALEVLQRTSVDVALVDIEMPRMNGYELLEKLRSDERYSSLPVIIITSRSGDQHRQRAMSLGADGYITKPYDIGVLDELMRKVVANKRALH